MDQSDFDDQPRHWHPDLRDMEEDPGETSAAPAPAILGERGGSND
jgi:hypothetical protein